MYVDLCNYNLPERDEIVTKVIRVMIKFNESVMIRPIMSGHKKMFDNIPQQNKLGG
jgi:hypothetical protein